ncbi:alkaline phosphatase-like protein [Sporormia fimetaria CBS 119925]|uniref:GPI ethanolamine phosphate transferase 2 n=1 Tax=Sporormia fimetaria CBS 119925 TaxID=1340428 RepID=A0A6A6VKJ3_9PLEO|nr:alkaline phosphatase-like protein [Sporormia fimetaria CBS 119925]
MASRTLFLVLANLLIPVAIVIFGTGFFPYKPFMPGLATYGPLGWDEEMGWTEEPEAPFNKLVFMVVDALRSDFVFGEESGMKYVQSLIESGAALPFTAHATSPTITMPRIKAITTGSVPSFLDVILNFLESDTTSSLAKQDTWLAQMRAKEGGKLVMYGDDTWLKLFPGFFERADGTTSFFVSDFTEVDNNVTRHVPEELLNSDWNGMVLHYLGLDHIGHKMGPKGPQMMPKQIEMDGIVQQIYEAIENEEHLSKTLFVLAGDHGMNEGGNHGGSSSGETSAALVFMSPRIKQITGAKGFQGTIKGAGEYEYYETVEQSDIAPTIAGLLGFPIPRNNLGVFIKGFIRCWEDGRDRTRLLLQNAKQVKKIVEATYPSLYFGNSFRQVPESGGNGQRLAHQWQKVVQVMTDPTSLESQAHVDEIYKFLYDAQDTLSTTASNYDVPKLYLGTLLAAISCVFAFLSMGKLTPFSSGIFLALTILLHSVSMFASSYVEEEHLFWYFITASWFVYLVIREASEWRPTWGSQWLIGLLVHPAMMVLYLHRIIQRWNQTGQKYAGAPDIVHIFSTAGFGSAVLWSLIGATYLDITTRLSQHTGRCICSFVESKPDAEPTDWHRFAGTFFVLPLGATAFIFKLAFTAQDAPELTRGISEGLVQWTNSLNLVGVARMVFSAMAVTSVSMITGELSRARARKGKRGGHGHLAVALFDLSTLFLMTQTKAENIPLFLLFRLQTVFLTHLSLTPTDITTTILLLTQTSFFASGNNNAISSISLSNAYNGISSYNPLLVALLVFASNWAAPIYWSLFGVLLLGSRERLTRFNDTNAVDDNKTESRERDWVTAERAHLTHLARTSPRTRDNESGGGEWQDHFARGTLAVSVALTSVMTACTVLRAHLFVWSVFSPKFLMGVAWAACWHLGVMGGLGGAVQWVGRW